MILRSGYAILSNMSLNSAKVTVDVAKWNPFFFTDLLRGFLIL